MFSAIQLSSFNFTFKLCWISLKIQNSPFVQRHFHKSVMFNKSIWIMLISLEQVWSWAKQVLAIRGEISQKLYLIYFSPWENMQVQFVESMPFVLTFFQDKKNSHLSLTRCYQQRYFWIFLWQPFYVSSKLDRKFYTRVLKDILITQSKSKTR